MEPDCQAGTAQDKCQGVLLGAVWGVHVDRLRATLELVLGRFDVTTQVQHRSCSQPCIHLLWSARTSWPNWSSEIWAARMPLEAFASSLSAKVEMKTHPTGISTMAWTRASTPFCFNTAAANWSKRRAPRKRRLKSSCGTPDLNGTRERLSNRHKQQGAQGHLIGGQWFAPKQHKASKYCYMMLD